MWYRFREVETHTDSHALTHAPVPHTLKTHTTHTHIHTAHITHTLKPTLTCIHTHVHTYISLTHIHSTGSTHTHSHTYCSHTHTHSYTTHTTHATYYWALQKVHLCFSKGSCRKPQTNFLANAIYPHTHHTRTTAFLWTNTLKYEKTYRKLLIKISESFAPGLSRKSNFSF